MIAVGIREETSPELAAEVDEIHWVSLGQLGKAIAALKGAGATEAVMAGQVKHRQIFSGVIPDLTLISILAKLAFKNTDSLIGAVADVLQKEGIVLRPSTELLADHMATEGPMTRRKPSGAEQRDVEYGRAVARHLAAMDLGQTVVVKDRAAVALEAMEGTDEAIRRAGSIAGKGTVIVKVAKPKQDMRFDVPVIGPGTLAAMRDAGSTVLAVEAARTLLLDRPALVAEADRDGLTVFGFPAEPAG